MKKQTNKTNKNLSEKYINPFTDFGFKRIFGEESNKDLLLDFLNQLLDDEGEITELSYLPNENLPISVGDRKAIFDIYCTNAAGEHFIVEMQKAEQQFFKDRMVYYSTFPIQEQARDKGKTWNFELKGVYAIGILDFVFEDEAEYKDQLHHNVMLTEQKNNKVFYKKLKYIFLEMPKFNKREDELKTKFDKWLYVLKNLPELEKQPDNIKEEVFSKLFKVAAVANLKPKEFKQYESSMNAYRDIFNVQNTAFEKGKLEGKLERSIEIAKKALSQGLPLDVIVVLTGLTETEIEKLK